MNKQYDVDSKNKVRQLPKKASYDRDTVYAILDSALLVSAGFVQDGEAVVVPMIFGREDETIYLHGARKARVVRLLEQTRQVCINATHIDGIVFARSAFNSSMNYRSVTVFGTARLVEGDDEKVRAMQVISEHVMPGRWDELRAPLEKELKMTGVIEVRIESASAKISAGMPNDEPEDYDIPIWAGVLPVESAFTNLVDDDRLLEGAEPSAVVRAMQGKLL